MNAIVERWDPARHMHRLEEWYKAREYEFFPGYQECIPKVGFLANRAVFGFLRLTDTPWAYVENFIADPKSDKARRRAAIDALVECLVCEARHHGVKYLAAYVSHDSLVGAAQRSGFAVHKSAHRYLLRRL